MSVEFMTMLNEPDCALSTLYPATRGGVLISTVSGQASVAHHWKVTPQGASNRDTKAFQTLTHDPDPDHDPTPDCDPNPDPGPGSGRIP